MPCGAFLAWPGGGQDAAVRAAVVAMSALHRCGDFACSWALPCLCADRLSVRCSGAVCLVLLPAAAPVSGTLPYTLWPPGLPGSQLTLHSECPPVPRKRLRRTGLSRAPLPSPGAAPSPPHLPGPTSVLAFLCPIFPVVSGWQAVSLFLPELSVWTGVSI